VRQGTTVDLSRNKLLSRTQSAGLRGSVSSVRSFLDGNSNLQPDTRKIKKHLHIDITVDEGLIVASFSQGSSVELGIRAIDNRLEPSQMSPSW
jgi:hypothetical protein